MRVSSFFRAAQVQAVDIRDFFTQTDAQGYFVTYHLDGAAEYTVSVKYEGASAKSRWVRLEEGERYDKFVLRLNDLEKHRKNRRKRKEARQAAWMVEPAK